MNRSKNIGTLLTRCFWKNEWCLVNLDSDQHRRKVGKLWLSSSPSQCFHKRKEETSRHDAPAPVAPVCVPTVLSISTPSLSPCPRGGTVRPDVGSPRPHAVQLQILGEGRPWDGSSDQPHTLPRTASITRLRAFRSLWAGRRERAAPLLLLGWQGRVYTDGRVTETTEQIPATNPFHTSEKKRKEWQRRAKANRPCTTRSCGLESSAVPAPFTRI